MNKLLSPTIDSSEISQINQAQGASVSVSKETADLIELGKYYGDLPAENLISQSLLPVIFGIFMILRIIAFQNAEQLAEAVTHINYKKI